MNKENASDYPRVFNKIKRRNHMLGRIIKSIIILVILALATGTLSFAKPVDLESAQKIGVTHLKAQELFFIKNLLLAPKSFIEKDGFSIQSSQTLKDPIGRTLAYIFDLAPEGYIVVSPDTDIHPVIVYSFEGRFPIEESPDNVLLHLVTWDMEKRLNALPLIDQQLRQENNTLWEKYLSGEDFLIEKLSSTKQYGPWLKNKWHQRNPYNKFCPLDPQTKKRCVVGCVATSMAQIINYWRHPKSVIFTDEDNYITSTRRIKIDGDHKKLDFPSFVELNNKLSNINYDGSEDEIAALCFACGISVKMDYTSVGSGAWLITGAYIIKFGYETAELKYPGQSGDFYNVLQKNMKNGEPAQTS